MKIRVAESRDAAAAATLISLAYRVEDFFKIGDRTDEADVLARMKKGSFCCSKTRTTRWPAASTSQPAGTPATSACCPSTRRGRDRALAPGSSKRPKIIAANAAARRWSSRSSTSGRSCRRSTRASATLESGTRPFPDSEFAKLPCHFIVMTQAAPGSASDADNSGPCSRPTSRNTVEAPLDGSHRARLTGFQEDGWQPVAGQLCVRGCCWPVASSFQRG